MVNPESSEQGSASGENIWETKMKDVESFEEQEAARDQAAEAAITQPESINEAATKPSETLTEPSEAYKPLTMEEMVSESRAHGYEPKNFGEQSFVAYNSEGKFQIYSNYNDIWHQMSKANPDFYNNPANQTLSKALYDVGRYTMYNDINPEGLEDAQFFQRINDESRKLLELAKNPEYAQQIDEFFNHLSDLGESGEHALAIYEVAQTFAAKGATKEKSASAPDPELERKQRLYDLTNQEYEAAMSAPALDSEKLEEIAASYHQLGDFADARARRDNIYHMLDRLKSISNIFGE